MTLDHDESMGHAEKKAVCEMEYSVLFIINPVLFKRLLQLTKSEIKNNYYKKISLKQDLIKIRFK